jgi:hypothetical protein
MSLRIIRGFTLYINDNINLALEIDALQLPPLEETTEAYHAGGADGEIGIAGLGTKELKMSFKLRSHTPEVPRYFNPAPGIRHAFTGRKLIIDEEDGTEHWHAIDMRARLTKISSQEMQGGKASGWDNEIGGVWEYNEYWDERLMHRFVFKRGGWVVKNYETVNSGRQQLHL